MYNINDTLTLLTSVKNKAIAKNNMATANVLNKVHKELAGMDANTYQAKAYVASIVPKLQTLNKAFS